MINQSIIKTTALHSPLAEASQISPSQKRHKKSLAAGLMITSLVDAFSILVIFLLASYTKSGEVLSLPKNFELPVSFHAEDLKKNILIKLDEGKIFLEDQEVSIDELLTRLLELRREISHKNQMGKSRELALTIQADRRVKYEKMSQIILAGAQSGFDELKFAVLNKQ